ncbi:MAG TPA: two-component regulator propeller domain-containing protein, partial [Methylomirabilota bacterium]|nr:two-component regulator propeller domain-containing protein [Methylomirabilota bacterium]
MPMRRWALLMAVVSLLCGSALPAADAFASEESGAFFTVDVWQTEDRLPQNSVIALMQAADGYLWLGTLNGLARFDGMRFTVFDDDTTPGLGSGTIVHLFEDGQTNLWIGTESAGVVLVRPTGELRFVELGRGSRAGRLMAACQDVTGAVWLYTADGQLARHREGRVDVIRLDLDRFSNCRSMVATADGRVLVGSDRRLITLAATAATAPDVLPVEKEVVVNALDLLAPSRKAGYWRLAEGRIQKWTTNGVERDLGPYPWSGVRPSAACEDAQGNLIVGTLGAGVYWFGAGGSVTRLSTNSGLSHSFVLSLCVDREQTLWVGTDGGGLNRVRPQVFRVFEPSRGLVAQSICEDAQGGIWIGYNGGGLDYWNGRVAERFVPGQVLSGMPVRSVLVDRGGRVLAGTLGPWGAGLFQWVNRRFDRVAAAPVANRDVSVLFEDRRGRLWVGTQAGLVCWDGHEWRVFTTQDGLSSDDVRAIAEDKAGNLWIGTRGGGLMRFSQGRFTVFRREDGLASDHVASLYVDEEDVLWIGTNGGGLGRWQAGQWTHYTVRDGLLSNRIGYLLEDDEGYLWLGSTLGLMRVSRQALNEFARGRVRTVPVRAYGRRDGLPMGECSAGSQPGACRTRDGRLWFPTIEGVAVVDPARLRVNTNVPPV